MSPGSAPGADDILAFDTGPGNALIDDWALRHTGQPVDRDGALARAGTGRRRRGRAISRPPYFCRAAAQIARPRRFRRARPGQGSVAGRRRRDADRDDGRRGRRARRDISRRRRSAGWSPAAAATTPRLMAVLGGRARRRRSRRSRRSGWDGDALEAQAFAYLAVRSFGGPAAEPARHHRRLRPDAGGVLHRAPLSFGPQARAG